MDGGPVSRFELEVRVEIRTLNEHGGWTGDRFAVSDQLKLDLDNFMEAAKILGALHDVAKGLAGVEPAAP
jgi:hypothetical protein